SEIETAQNMGIRGVPCFLIENKYAVMGAQDPATLADAIRQVAAMKARGELEAAS
ncbi:MAG: DsbA family protein, partial [Nitratireductor sp.]